MTKAPLSPDEPLLPHESHGKVEVNGDGDDLGVDQGHGDVAVGGHLSRAVNETFTHETVPEGTFSNYCENFHEISLTAVHLSKAGPVAGDLTQQPVVAGGALDDAVIMRAAADLSRPLQHEILQLCLTMFVRRFI